MANNLRVSVILVLAALAGCGGDSEQTPSPPAIPAGLTDDVPRVVADACEKTTAKFDGPVYCPPLVPVGQTWLDVAGEHGSRTYVMSFRTDSIRPEPHWLVIGGDAQEVDELLRINGTPQLVDRRRIEGMPTKVYELDYPNINSGHVVFTWEHDGAGYLASVHGFQHDKLAEGIAVGLIREMRADA